MPPTLIDEYARSLAGLEGQDFQAEVCARLASVIIGFQTVPAKPHGDAGLDGLSHQGSRGCCCYGPEHAVFKTNQSREKAIVKKFSTDLLRLLELEVEGGRLVHKESPEMKTILAPGQQLQHVDLVTNWFESHRVIGPLAAKLDEYKKASQCRYVSPNATATVVGPRELANQYAVDELTLQRAHQRVFIKRVHEVAQTIQIDDPRDFDAKLEVLRQIRPDQLPAIDALAEAWRNSWRMALAFERELDSTVPSLHHSLEQARRQILVRVSELMLATERPWTELLKAEDVAKSILESEFGTQYGVLVPGISSGEIARLIGECPVGWKIPEVKNDSPVTTANPQ